MDLYYLSGFARKLLILNILVMPVTELGFAVCTSCKKGLFSALLILNFRWCFMENIVKERVHQLYWDADINCARTALTCLGEQFQVDISKQTMNAAIGLHGAGGYRAQCGLVEGALMFIGIYLSEAGKNAEEISKTCYQFAEQFTEKYGSLRCFDLRPNGFSETDPPHACESLTGDAIIFTCQFIANLK